MTWIYEANPIDESILDQYVGFVYCITNVADDRKYIGKKLLKFKKSKIVKGKKKRFLVESDWKKYWGSNKQLIADVQELGEDKFVREILTLCKSKSECNYWEAKYQFQLGVIESDKYYNEQIMVRVHKNHLKSFFKNFDHLSLSFSAFD
jgi:hypothetical protein